METYIELAFYHHSTRVCRVYVNIYVSMSIFAMFFYLLWVYWEMPHPYFNLIFKKSALDEWWSKS